MKRIISLSFQAIIICYKVVVSPLFSARCRYTPTCSQYGLEAIKKYGPYKGAGLVIKRIFNCHPWGGKGYDPVP